MQLNEEDRGAALHLIVLGSGGGPREDNTTAFLIRSIGSRWRRGSIVAIDAGTHLTAIIQILEQHPPQSDTRPIVLTSGPFKGLKVPYQSVTANAAHITKDLVDTYLVTHPHLDHIAGFVVNTAIPGIRPKRLAALPHTIEAFKNHVFNNVIWPNLSDENGGAGLVSYMRLVEGGSPMIGSGEARGYVEICEGLSVKTWPVSHGHCIDNPHDHGGSEVIPRSRSLGNLYLEESPTADDGTPVNPVISLLRSDRRSKPCMYTSSAYFVRDIETGREVLAFGDVEPDSISESPRNRHVWIEAAPKIVAGKLGGILIECSFAEEVSDENLYGHLAPRHVIAELKVLALQVQKVRQAAADPAKGKKRKTPPGADGQVGHRRSGRNSASPAPRYTEATSSPSISRKDKVEQVPKTFEDEPLKGLRVVIIHVKDRLDDGEESGIVIGRELKELEEEVRLGCEFVISKAGMSMYF